jgi:hypothetical protein
MNNFRSIKVNIHGTTSTLRSNPLTEIQARALPNGITRLTFNVLPGGLPRTPRGRAIRPRPRSRFLFLNWWRKFCTGFVFSPLTQARINSR